MALSSVSVHVSLLASYRSMFLTRRFETRCLELRRADEFSGSIHLCAGQEAIPTGALSAMEAGDRVVATYRGHGWALACGVPIESLMAEICQRASGTNGGRAGSPFLSAPEFGFLGENSIVGAGVPLAAGAALAAVLTGSGRVAVVSIGDGATSQGATHEALVFAASRKLPMIVVCENNGWSEMTPFATVAGETSLVERVGALGMPAVNVDGNDPEAVADAVATAAARARAGDGPSFIEARCQRLWGHYNSDIEHYRPQADRDAAAAADPLPALRDRLIATGTPEGEVERLETDVQREIDAAAERVLAAPHPDPASARDHVYAPPRVVPEEATGSQESMTYVKAINEALRRELAECPEVIVYGEDIAAAGGIFGATRGLQESFGPERVFDTPIAEAAILGSAVGAAMEGLRPVVEIMWADFLLVALDQLVNQAANVRYLSRGERSAPMVVRTQQGVTPGSCAQHSQSLEALLAHIPGLRVGLPATPQDAYSMLRAAIADDDPCVLFEARSLYGGKGPVSLDSPVRGIGGARVVREGADVAIIAWGSAVPVCEAASELLAQQGIEATLLDLRWLSPLDSDAIAAAVSATNRVLVVHEANLTGGFGAEVAARIAHDHFDELDAPVTRLGAPDVRFPSAPSLQAVLAPSAADVVAAVEQLVGA